MSKERRPIHKKKRRTATKTRGSHRGKIRMKRGRVKRDGKGAKGGGGERGGKERMRSGSSVVITFFRP